MGVSAHCLIRRDGEVVQFVPFNARAWHAGVSSFAGREKCNDYSIGIELEGSDFVAYTDAQYAALTDLTKELQQRFLIDTQAELDEFLDLATDLQWPPPNQEQCPAELRAQARNKGVIIRW